ncbi:MAG: hypothetical protein RLZZ292_2915 [Bacteroidota bacterium]|jgi:UTP-glucose-1-phosphate uridylyltransferase
MKPTLLILAAGMGSRYGGIKQIDGVGPNGEIIIEYSVYDAIRAGFGKVVFVIRKAIEADFKAIFEGKFDHLIKVEYVFQETENETQNLVSQPLTRTKPWGTGHAILMASKVIHEPFVAINADDFYGYDAFRLMADFLKKDCTPQHFCMVGYTLQNTLSENGTVSRGVCRVNDAGHLTSVVEHLGIERLENNNVIFVNEQNKQEDLDENAVVSMNYWGFHPTIFDALRTQFQDFARKNWDNPKAEFYIPTVVSTLINAKKADVTVLTSSGQWYGVTYREDRATVQTAFTKMLDEKVYPQSLWA